MIFGDRHFIHRWTWDRLCLSLVTSRAAAYRAPGQTNTSAAGNIAVVTGIGYGALLIGPPVIGFVSEHVSLLWGMAIVAACAPDHGAVGHAVAPPICAGE